VEQARHRQDLGREVERGGGQLVERG
jgi:hypothetical protein